MHEICSMPPSFLSRTPPLHLFYMTRMQWTGRGGQSIHPMGGCCWSLFHQRLLAVWEGVEGGDVYPDLMRRLLRCLPACLSACQKDQLQRCNLRMHETISHTQRLCRCHDGLGGGRGGVRSRSRADAGVHFDRLSNLPYVLAVLWAGSWDGDFVWCLFTFCVFMYAHMLDRKVPDCRVIISHQR